MKKILYIVTGLGMGGAERQVLDLASAMSNNGHSTLIIYLTGGIDVKNIPFNALIEKTFDFKKNPIKGFISLIRIIKKFQPDVVHSHMLHANIVARLSRLLVNIPVLISTAHSNNEGGWWRMRAYQLTDRLADISTNVSKEAVKVFEIKGAVPVGRMIAVHNGIDVERFKKNSNARSKTRVELGLESEIVFLAIGRLVEAKDYPNLLNAFCIVSKKYISARLFIVGDGPLLCDLKCLCKSLGIEDKVKFLGLRDDVHNLINAADFFVLSSAWEGFGLVVAEAMASEKLVIATDCGGVAEVMGGHGFLVKPRDSHLLADAMCKSMTMEFRDIEKLALSARSWVVEKYSINSLVGEWEKIYRIIYN